MKKIILIMFMVLSLNIIAYAELQHYYEINLEYNYGNISLNSIEVRPINYKVEETVGDFIVEILDYNDKTLKVTFFNIPLEIYYDAMNKETGQIDKGGILRLNESKKVLMLPYYKNAKEIIIYDNKLNEKIKIDVSQYSKMYIPSEINEEDTHSIIESGLKTSENVKKRMINLFIILFVLILIIIFLYYGLYKKRDS